jgi:hypothetical protein
VEITDDMCRYALAAMSPDRIQGFSTPNENRTKWGAPHYIRDVSLPSAQQEMWRGDSHDEMMERCEIERMRLGLKAALDL